MNRRSLGCLLEIAETLVLTIVIFLVIQNFVAQPYRVEQQSMQHTLDEGQYVLVDKLTPKFDSYKRGDIVVFHPKTGDEQTPFIKRVIGVPGDRIEFKDGAVYVNGAKLTEPYTYDYPKQQTEPGENTGPIVVPPNELFVMGDHRTNSQDSRAFGPIEASSVIGRAWLRYWPITTLGILQTPTYPNVGSTPVSVTTGAQAGSSPQPSSAAASEAPASP